MWKLFYFFLFSHFYQYGCGEKLYGDNVAPSTSVFPEDAGDERLVSYEIDIKPILDGQCTSCHSAETSGAGRNGAPVGVDLDTYLGAKASAVESNEEIAAGSMPPFAPLPASEKEAFQNWIDDGLIESDCECASASLNLSAEIIERRAIEEEETK